MLVELAASNATTARSAHGCACRDVEGVGAFCAAWGEPLPGVSWCHVADTCEFTALRRNGSKVASCEGGGTVMVTEHNCSCLGTSNPDGHGGYCRRWDDPEQRAWCYVNASCPSPRPADDFGKLDECDDGDAFEAYGVDPAAPARRLQPREPKLVDGGDTSGKVMTRPISDWRNMVE